MQYSGGHRGYRLSQRPKKYPRTAQQQKFRGALDHCGIKRGIKKAELMEKMRLCIPEYFKEHTSDSKDLPLEALRPMQGDRGTD